MREANLQTDTKGPEPCDDAVSREALRKAMYHRAFETDGDTMWQSGCWIRYRAVEQVIKESPSVTPKQKRGKWLPENRTNDAFWACSECKFPSEAHGANIIYNFCPNCGARMTEEEA